MGSLCPCFSHFLILGSLLLFTDYSPSLIMQLLKGHFKYNHYPLIFFRRLLFPPISSAKCWLLVLFVKQGRALFCLAFPLTCAFIHPGHGAEEKFPPPLWGTLPLPDGGLSCKQVSRGEEAGRPCPQPTPPRGAVSPSL